MDVSKLNLKDNYKGYITDMRYDDQQASLFLLGCLVGAVGRSQNSKTAAADNSGTYKPILNKINFNGMDFVKVKRLSNEILNKLRQEKILRYTEAIFSAHKMLMGLNEKNWKYNKDENLYYILSGYAYETMKKREEKKDE
jgi:CRISPR-associated protein Csh1